MNKSEKLIKSLNDDELKVLLLVFAYPKVIDALKCYHTIPSYMKSAFINPGRIELINRGIISPSLSDKRKNRLISSKINKV